MSGAACHLVRRVGESDVPVGSAIPMVDEVFAAAAPTESRLLRGIAKPELALGRVSRSRERYVQPGTR